ncbi:MAG: adenylate/guanylate cyclase domain-containing protein, partial [Candidatus Electrothrix sp. AUS1_2]|nr:adenylate/guanylate cyclase domain-containing protein [Candidatus Electrothrix sp. AUS1_2]
AIFGALIKLDHPSFTAIETALAIRERFAGLKEAWQARDPFFTTIDLGFAVTRGEMFLGNVGSARRLDYTVIGTEVNIAQRLASKATSSRIYITDKVLDDLKRNQLDHKVVVKDVGRMALKGVQYSVQTFSVLGLQQEIE